MTAAIYLGELVFAVGLAIVLLTTSTFASSVAILLFCCGVAAWTRGRIPHPSLCVACYFPGRTPASSRSTARRCRQDLLAIWLAFAVVYLTMGGSVLAGVLAAYAWYLSVHHCAIIILNSPRFVGQASPRSSTSLRPKLRCSAQNCGSRFRNDGSMTRGEDAIEERVLKIASEA